LSGPTARLLDLTRLISRAGRTLTGIDRVELAYLRALQRQPIPTFGLVRTAVGYILLDRAGLSAVERAVIADDWGAPDRIARLSRLPPAIGAAQAFVRARAQARCLPPGLGAMLRRRLPAGTAYLNVGHSNLTARVLTAVRSVPGARIAVMLHDTIPLDFPDWQRPGTVAEFAGKCARVSALADLVITTSASAAADVSRHLTAMGRMPDGVTAHLGVTVTAPTPGDLPDNTDLRRPWFVTVGTIEPRKNHMLLLDVWDRLGHDAPMLYLAGGGGWQNDAIMARMQAGHPRVRLLPGLSDGAVAALLQGAQALLFPSRAEGFGLPVPEALALGTPVVAAPLPIWQELVGDRPVYLDPDDPAPWIDTVLTLTQSRPTPAPYQPPDWDSHFKDVLTRT
jgi:glycosyltransferase involved in cell wall biosynthesis